MLWALLMPAALAEAPPAPNADILTDVTVAASPAAMAAVLTDLAAYKKAVPSSCLGRFEIGTPNAGLGATARVRYDMAAMHRNLTLTVSRADLEPTRAIVDYSHATNLGFTTRWVMTAAEGGTHVTVQTGLTAPAWPFTAYFFTAIQPEWTTCQAAIVQNVAKLAGSTAPAP